MDEHTASELAYNRGLEDGVELLAQDISSKVEKAMEVSFGAIHSTYASVLDLIHETTMDFKDEPGYVRHGSTGDAACITAEKPCKDPSELFLAKKATVCLLDDLPAKPKRYVVDFEICCTVQELKLTLADINRYSYPIVAITQCVDAYTVFFRRTMDV